MKSADSSHELLFRETSSRLFSLFSISRGIANASVISLHRFGKALSESTGPLSSTCGSSSRVCAHKLGVLLPCDSLSFPSAPPPGALPSGLWNLVKPVYRTIRCIYIIIYSLLRLSVTWYALIVWDQSKRSLIVWDIWFKLQRSANDQVCRSLFLPWAAPQVGLIITYPFFFSRWWPNLFSFQGLSWMS
jgi:hypothetical protein